MQINIQDDSGAQDVSALQVQVVETSSPTDPITTQDGSIVTGDNLVVTKTTTTTVTDLQTQSDDLATQIAALQAQKDDIDALLPQVTDKLNALAVSSNRTFTAPVSNQLQVARPMQTIK